MDAQDQMMLKQIILRLPLRERQVFYLHYVEDLSFREISEVLLLREDHVYVLLNWAESKIAVEAEKKGVDLEF